MPAKNKKTDPLAVAAARWNKSDDSTAEIFPVEELEPVAQGLAVRGPKIQREENLVVTSAPGVTNYHPLDKSKAVGRDTRLPAGLQPLAERSFNRTGPSFEREMYVERDGERVLAPKVIGKMVQEQRLVDPFSIRFGVESTRQRLDTPEMIASIERGAKTAKIIGIKMAVLVRPLAYIDPARHWEKWECYKGNKRVAIARKANVMIPIVEDNIDSVSAFYYNMVMAFNTDETPFADKGVALVKTRELFQKFADSYMHELLQAHEENLTAGYIRRTRKGNFPTEAGLQYLKDEFDFPDLIENVFAHAVEKGRAPVIKYEDLQTHTGLKNGEMAAMVFAASRVKQFGTEVSSKLSSRAFKLVRQVSDKAKQTEIATALAKGQLAFAQAEKQVRKLNGKYTEDDPNALALMDSALQDSEEKRIRADQAREPAKEMLDGLAKLRARVEELQTAASAMMQSDIAWTEEQKDAATVDLRLMEAAFTAVLEIIQELPEVQPEEED